MSDYTRIERELTSHARQRAASASPPPDAWERFAASRAGRGDETTALVVEEAIPIESGEYIPTEGTNDMERKWWTIGLVAVAAVVLIVVGIVAATGGDEDAPVATDDGTERLIGTWEFSADAFPSEMQLDEDGSFEILGPRVTQGDEIIQAGSTIDQGQYVTEGDLVTFSTDDVNEGVWHECAGATGRYVMTFDGTDTLNLELVDDPCSERTVDLDSAQLVRISG